MDIKQNENYQALYKINDFIRKNNIDAINDVINNPTFDINLQDENGDSALHLAILYRNFQVIKLFVSKKANINIRDIDGKTPLMSHLERNADMLIVNFLLENGASLISRDKNGITPLMYAVISKNLEAVKKLVYMGANIDDNDYFKRNVKSYALKYSYKIFEFLEGIK